MKHKTLFRILLKFMAVWLFVEGIGICVSALLNTAYFVLTDDWDIFYMLPELIWGTCQTLIALYLFFGGKWIADLAVPGNRPYCHECGYDLSHAPGKDCPECGTEFRLTTKSGV